MRRYLPVLSILLIWGCVSRGEREKVLSRKRRHLLFPEGSSLQLVYEFTVPISYSDTIFVFATTAALAWMLPTSLEDFENGFFSKKFHKVPINNRIDSDKTKFYNTEFTHSKPYEKYSTDFNSYTRYRPQIIRFNKPFKYQHSIQHSPAFLQSTRRKYYVMNNNNKYRPSYYNYHDPVTSYVNPTHGYYHRRTGRDLFKKIETFLSAQKKNGKICVLKAICEVHEESASKKGTFTEELFKSIFRFSPSHTGETDVYDKASVSQNCSELYPCDFSIWEVI